jgi:RNA polymerase sigma factor (TIGR02999 family)
LLTEELFPLVYAELRRLARARLAREPGRGGGHILQPTALVHEAYLRLVGEAADKTLTWTSRAHFFGAAALAMRRILVEHARRRRAPSAGLEGDLLPSTGVFGEAEGRAVDFEELDAALTAFAQSDERRHGVVMLRFFAGLSVEATAQVLNLSEPTVKRDWNYARAWLVEWIGARRGGPGA